MTLYCKRCGIEFRFRDTKDLFFGMCMTSIQVSTPERRDRIGLLEPNTNKQCNHSLVRRGCLLNNLAVFALIMGFPHAQRCL